MKPIPEEIVEKTWREVAQFTPAQIKKEISRVGREQGNFLSFVLESTVDMSGNSRELAVYLFFTVFRMFQKVHGKGIAPISSEEVMACYEANEDLMERLEGADEKFLDRIAKKPCLMMIHGSCPWRLYLLTKIAAPFAGCASQCV